MKFTAAPCVPTKLFPNLPNLNYQTLNTILSFFLTFTSLSNPF